MEIVVKVGVCRKIGQPNYGSYQASCHIDCPANIALIANPDELESLIAQLYKTCVDSVNTELASSSQSKAVVQSPVAQPAPEKPKSSVFGQWLKDKAIAYGVDMPVLTGLLCDYMMGGEVIPGDWTDKGRKLAEMWNANTRPDREEFYEKALTAALESLNDPH